MSNPKPNTPAPVAPELEKKSQYATLAQISTVLNVEPRWINRLVKERGFPQIARGQYDLVACVHWYIVDLKRQIQDAKSGGETLNEAQARLTKANANLKEMELSRERGEIIAIDDMKKVLEKLFKPIREALLAIPKALAPQVMSRQTIAEVEELLQTSVHKSLNELADSNISDHIRGMAAASKRRASGGDVDLSASAEAQGQSVGRRPSTTKPRKQRRARTVAH
jgi:phage terminase Nu1 subunit (DNA packaging protein)